jgi:hypothetical protein
MKQWQEERQTLRVLTATGIVQELHLIPFSSLTGYNNVLDCKFTGRTKIQVKGMLPKSNNKTQSLKSTFTFQPAKYFCG